MEHIAAIQKVLEKIDKDITEQITIKGLADSINFSAFHFCRLFLKMTGMSVMQYVTHRKLQLAMKDICCGKKVIDVAMEYGFETHAGFTKAFKRCYGYPPSLFRIHTGGNPPDAIRMSKLINENKILGGRKMQPQIIQKKDMVVVGYKSRHSMPNILHTKDIPIFWDTINLDYSTHLSKLHHTFCNSGHCEYSICFDADLNTGEFTYMLGVGVDNAGDLDRIESDMYRIDIPGGLYAVFTTPLVENEQYKNSIRETWQTILNDWLPVSEYEFDEGRYDFEYYDKRDHSWENGGKVQMDICIPVRKRKK